MNPKLLIAKDTNETKNLSRLVEQGKLRRIYHGIYTDALKEPIETIVQSQWMQIVSHIVSEGILSFRTAHDLKPIPYKKDQFIVFMTSSYVKTIILPGLIVKVLKGNNHSFIEKVLPNLSRSNCARMLLENLSLVRSAKYKEIKTIGKEGVEEELAKEMRFGGEKRLNQIRDEAKEIADELGFETEYKILNQFISALLSTHSDVHVLKTPYAKALVKKELYDVSRLKLFEKLCLYLQKCKFKDREYQFNMRSYKNISFFESYFSNFIEGTEFAIDEAEDIVFSGREIHNRHADSHDVLSLFYMTNDFSEMSKIAQNEKEFLESLQARHAYLMKERPDKYPGVFKKKRNKAENTYFVAPEEVVGTLTRGFEFYQVLKGGMQRALFMQFLISEVHPFDDGNGRLSRIMMNAELVSAGLFKIIVPTVHRENYLNGLRQASRDQFFLTYCKVLDQAQAYTESVPWLNYADAREKIEADDADKTSDEGLPIFNRVLRQLALSDFAI